MGSCIRGYIPTLDGWRAVAVGLVILYHSFMDVFPKDSTSFFLASRGAKGVDIFFALSGLLITTRLLEERAANGRINLSQFYVRRAFRILPPYFLYLGVLALLALAGVVSVSRLQWLGCVGFFRNYLPEPDVWGRYTGHFWSLSVEEHFYLLWPFLLVLLGTRKAGGLAVLLAVAISVWRKVDQHYQILSPFGLGRSDTNMDAILWGGFAAVVVHHPAARAWLSRRLTLSVWVGLVVVAVYLVLAEPPFGMTLLAVLMPWLLLGTVFNPTSWPSRLLETAPLRWLGRISYSLYLWQQLFIFGVLRHLGVLQSDAPWQVNLALALPATLAAAAGSYYLVERPILRIGHRLTRVRQPSIHFTSVVPSPT
jgi:peptidoglycan/LPS O-acetylase OafA/YrhL